MHDYSTLTHDLNCMLLLEYKLTFSFFPVVQQPKSGLGHLLLELSRSRSDTPHLAGLLWMRDQSVADTFTWQHTNTEKRQMCMPVVGFVPMIPASTWPKVHALDRVATEIDINLFYLHVIFATLDL
jgi:hypothetical protein